MRSAAPSMLHLSEFKLDCEGCEFEAAWSLLNGQISKGQQPQFVTAEIHFVKASNKEQVLQAFISRWDDWDDSSQWG